MVPLRSALAFVCFTFVLGVLGAHIDLSRPTVPEGQTLSLRGTSSLSFLDGRYLWDLDADGVYGEFGSSAAHGDEVGRAVTFITVGRDGSRVAAGAWPVYLHVVQGMSTEQASASITVTNVAPSITSTGGPYTATGASATLTASAQDPGGSPVTVLWDLDFDGIFGETGADATNGDEVGATVRFAAQVTERDRVFQVRVRATDGQLQGPIATTTVTVPGLLSTHRCPCTISPTGQCATGIATGSALSVTNSQRIASVDFTALTSRTSGAQSGGWFRARPIPFDTTTMDGFHFCGSFQVLATSRIPPTYSNSKADGGISFAITTATPVTNEVQAGNSSGIVGRPQTTGVAVRFITSTDAVVQVANTFGFPATNAPKSSHVPVQDSHLHQFAVQYDAGIQRVQVWIDGVLVVSQFFNLLDEGVLGKGPVFRLYPGMVASSSSAFRQDILVSTDFQFCTFNQAGIMRPTCAVDCTATQTTNGCNVKTESPTSCGGFSCSSNNIPSPACVDRTCIGTCDSTHADCNGDKAVDGCETNIATDIYNCGGCGVSCPQINGTASCVDGVCQVSCSSGRADCNLDVTDGCEVSTATDVNNCGACGFSCASLGIANAQCVGGRCQGACASGFLDCNANMADGCETNVGSNPNQCGGCTTSCSSANVQNRLCVGGSCKPACAAGFADCNSTIANDGCETNVATSLSNCGACGVACSTNHINAVCSNGYCNGVCQSGYFDCNNNKAADGCESNPLIDPSNCGSCGAACSTNHMASTTCSGGQCSGTCATGWANCDGDLRSNGCEQDVSSDVQNCGGCGNKCSSSGLTPLCVNSQCTGPCYPGFANCDANFQSNGCEINLLSDPDHCSACTGKVCSGNHIVNRTCTNGVCNGLCTAGYYDCNSDKLTDGCEQDIANDANNCGGCGFVCSSNHISTTHCTNGICDGACNSGWADCNSNKTTDGCEIHTDVDTSNCGSCGYVCSAHPITNAATYTCSGGSCMVSTCNSNYCHSGNTCINNNSGCGSGCAVCTGGTNCIAALGACM